MDSFQPDQELGLMIFVSLFQPKLFYDSMLDFPWNKNLETALSSISSQWNLSKLNIQFSHVSMTISKLPDIFSIRKGVHQYWCFRDVQFSCTVSFQQSFREGFKFIFDYLACPFLARAQ